MLQRAGGSLAGEDDTGGGEDTSVWHMWLAAGVGVEEPGGRMMGGCDCAGGGEGGFHDSEPCQSESKEIFIFKMELRHVHVCQIVFLWYLV